MGLGLHGGGLGVTKWLARHGATVTVTDLRSRKVLKPSLDALKGLKGIRFVLGRHRLQDFASADLVIQNPAVPSDSEFIRHAHGYGIPVLNEAALFFRLVAAPVIGITGTKGKSSVTAFLGQLMRSHAGKVATVGNIRHSFFTAVDRMKRKDRVIAELSSWHLEGLIREKRSPHIAVLTNVHPDHLNRYPSYKAYADVKAGIFAHQKRRDIAVLNWDNAPSRAIGKRVHAQKYWFSLKRFAAADGVFLHCGWIVLRRRGKEQKIGPRNHIPFTAQDDVANVLAAVLTARLAGIAPAALCESLPTLKKLPGRRERVRRFHGRVFLNDTTATSPTATIQSIRAVHESIILIVGGENKQLSYRELVAEIIRHVEFCAVLPGSASDLLVRGFNEKGYRTYRQVKSMQEAVQVAWQKSRVGDVILLSPAAASFNLFHNEFHRAEVFIRAVKRLS